MIVEKIPLGVTVREIEYIEDPAISSAAHPVYALLISKEVENDLGHLNDDGLSPEEREEMKEEKEKNMLAKQVEADLGGFEIDQEWVEEIDRDDCFEIEKRYGGCPSNPQSKYEVWVSCLKRLGIHVLYFPYLVSYIPEHRLLMVQPGKC